MDPNWRYKFIEQLLIDLYGEVEGRACSRTLKRDIPNLIDKLGDDNKEYFDHLVHQIRAFVPIQYLTQKVYFHHIELYVDNRVLIPRPETEELILHIIYFCQNNSWKPNKILDIGTGSGCIALALKSKFPDADVVGIDVSPDALQVASINSDRLNLDVQWFELDFLNDNAFSTLNQDFDLVVSNPPYIALEEGHLLSQNVIKHEPAEALFAPDHNPLAFYERIAHFISFFKNLNANVFCEINEFRAEQTQIAFLHHGLQTELIKDIQGKSRFIHAYPSLGYFGKPCSVR